MCRSIPATSRATVEGALGMLRNLAKCIRRDAIHFGVARQGATMVEFAIIAPVFIAMLVAIFETTIFLFAQANLQDAAVAAGRVFMTGQVQNSNLTKSQFTSEVCPLIQAVFTCGNLMVNVQSYSDFSSANAS